MKKYLKIFIFLMTIICINQANDVHAADTYFFERGEDTGVNVTYTNVESGSTINFEMYVLKNTNEDRFAYLYYVFTAQANPVSGVLVEKHDKLSDDDISYIQSVIHYGYQYGDHNDIMWYVATQDIIWKYMIGKERVGDSLVYKDSSNRNVTYEVEQYANTIKNLVQYSKLDQFIDGGYEGLVGDDLTLVDLNNTFQAYDVAEKSDNVEVVRNVIYFKNLKEGEQSVTLSYETEEERDGTLVFQTYLSAKWLGYMFLGGKLGEGRTITYTVTGVTNHVNITKVDSDTNLPIPQGEASLAGARYGVYNKDTDELVAEGIVGDNSTVTIKNIPYGSYYIQEIEAGQGYTLNDTKTYFEFTYGNHEVNLTLKNSVISKKITLHKEYGVRNNTIFEDNITFEIYDSYGNLVTTVITDEFGDASATLAYGKYIVKQVNTKDGYTMVDDFVIRITEEDKAHYYKLFDYEVPKTVKIEVPDTGVREGNLEFLFLILLLLPIGLKKKNVT